jgi:hypothetical protein
MKAKPMPRNRSTVDLAARWAQLTGTPLKEATQRVRVLRLDHQLPDSRSDRTPLTPEHIATFIIAAMASDTHLDAPKATRRYAKLRAEIAGEPAPLTKRLAGLTLANAIAELLRKVREGGPQFGFTLQISTTQTRASLLVAEGDGDTVALIYGSVEDADGPPWPIQREATLAGPVLGRMAKLIGPATHADMTARIDEYEADAGEAA